MNPTEPADIPAKLIEILPDIHSLKEIGINKELAKIGDSVTNLIYSLAKSIVIGNYDARKVSKDVLSKALKDAGLKKYAKARSDAHALADTSEAFIGYIHIAEKWSLDKMVSILVVSMLGQDLYSYVNERNAATEAFTKLLIEIKNSLSKILKDGEI
jgi:Ribonuclease III